MAEPLVVFIDTNALLHYPPLAQIDWCKVCNAEAITIMLCQPVINELDKYKSDPRLGERARSRIREIDQHIEKEVRTGVRVGVYNAPLRSADFPDTLSPESFDDRITHFALMYEKREAKAVAVITEDLGMKLRCRSHNVRVISPPEGQRLQSSQTDEQKKILELQRQLADIRNKQPAIHVMLSPDSVHELKRPVLQLPNEAWGELQEAIRSRFYLTDTPLRSGDTQFLRDMDQWLRNNYRVADESARTIQAQLTIANTGAAPANGVDLTVQFPDSIVAIFYEASLSGERAIPMNRPISNRRDLVLVEPAKPVPHNLWAVGHHLPFVGRLNGRKFEVTIPALAHADERTFPPLYLTFRSWEDVGTFTVNIRVRTLDPADLYDRVIPVKVELAVE